MTHVPHSYEGAEELADKIENKGLCLAIGNLGANEERELTPFILAALRSPSGSVGPWKECVYKHPDAPNERDFRDEFRCTLSTIAGLAAAKGSNALHEIACTALAGLARLKEPPATPSPIEKEKPCS